ncbi:MAG: hypothetical protein Q4G50_06755 [Corynebacterium sp.]|uniref:hypothetical protein n=1 Tax=Corynebacterium sp. TaxID=1720 RepID=UPI0026DED5A6|nr:hypothetical protein [Corynebacterium sp.]MDO5669686.1 hypothetical protein [Corynebacterium sp.]
MTHAKLYVDLVPASGIVTPGGWEPLAVLAEQLSDARIHLTEAGHVRLYGASADSLIDVAGFHPARDPAPEPGEIGWLGQTDGHVHLGAGLRLGMMSTQIARMLDVIEAPVRVCRGGILQIEGLEEGVAEQVVRVLAPLGLIFDAGSSLLQVSACGNCGLSRSDVHLDALQAAAEGVDGPTHFAGCGHRCGAPSGDHVEYLALGEGEYEVS